MYQVRCFHLLEFFNMYIKSNRTLGRDGPKALDYIYINIIDKLNERWKMLHLCLLTNDSQPT